METTISPIPATTRRPTVGQIALGTASGLCGFLTLFGVAHLALTEITKPSGYVFFGTLAVVPPLVALIASRFGSRFGSPNRVWRRFGFGAAMCLLAIPTIYLARFAPEPSQQTVRNLLGLPFFLLALVGPGLFRRGARS